MSLLTLVQELWRFIKDSVGKLVIGGLIVGLMMVGFRYMAGRVVTQEVNGEEQILQEAYLQEPAEFQVVITDELGKLFTNSFVIEEYFRTPEVVGAIETTTGTNFQAVLAAEEEYGTERDADYRGGLAGVRNTSSDVITFRFLIGETAADNLKIAQAYQQLLEQGEVPFLADHQIVVFYEATNEELLSTEYLEMVASPTGVEYFNRSDAPSLIVYGLAGCLVGILLTGGLLFIYRLFAPTITYAYEYSWELDDHHLMLDANKDVQGLELQALLKIPDATKRLIVLAEKHQALVAMVKSDILSEMTVVKDLQTGIAQGQTTDEIAIVIESNQTTKAWLKNQMILAQLYSKPIKLIHIY